MDLEFPVVLDEAELPELVHKKADPRACGADARRQNILVDHRDGLHLPILAQIGEEQQKPGQAALARIEQLIDQVRLDLNVARQKEGHEHLGDRRLFVHHTKHRGLLNSDELRFRHR